MLIGENLIVIANTCSKIVNSSSKLFKEFIIQSCNKQVCPLTQTTKGICPQKTLITCTFQFISPLNYFFSSSVQQKNSIFPHLFISLIGRCSFLCLSVKWHFLALSQNNILLFKLCFSFSATHHLPLFIDSLELVNVQALIIAGKMRCNPHDILFLY